MTWKTRPRSEFGGLAAIDEGLGPLVVLLHGVGLRAEAWGGQIGPLVSAGYRVLCPDMVGHGETVFVDPDGLDSYAAPIADLLQEPAVLIGHSMGAVLATRIAATGQSQIRGVVGLNAIFQRSAQAQDAILARARALDGVNVNDPSVTLHRWFGGKVSAERDACEQWLRDVDPRAYKAAYTAFAESDGPTAAQLSGIACPALFMTGADEPNSTPQMSRAMAELAPRGRAEVLSNAAHMMPMTHAAEVNAILLAFLQECFS
ncbi:alpha/beta fold hydrolase [Ruegeria meonggei]|uniref:Non-heme bromoperoxidase BPO-A2 n=1 Tax=Ruegeria meonggei TaxID=1446476 RepID=A0A1X7A3P1_9RHOB|nr:alpha/beta hydrolase [Ruegeria meonggei]SLN69158.1 Non-heme bromoperoxidase BPO-A2 [Ruegeria meonggei]